MINENDAYKERYDLVIERINQIVEDNSVKKPYDEYFNELAAFLLKMNDTYNSLLSGDFFEASIEDLAEHNYNMYADILPANYQACYANPEYCSKKLEKSIFAGLLSFLYVELRGMIVYVYEQRLSNMTILMELFLQVYCLFADEIEPTFKEVHDAIYWYVSDYADIFIDYRIREQLDSSLSFATDIIMNCDLNDIRYLYRFGEYITENELKTARFLNSLPKETIEKMAYTFVEGYRKGFEITGKDIRKKDTVNIRYVLGFERVVREEIKLFQKLGLKTTIYRAACESINKRMHIRVGYYGAIPNKQLEYDHRFDNAIYLDKAFVERKLSVTKVAYEKYKELAIKFAGPAVMEIFGDIPFEPVNATDAYDLSDKQKELSVSMANEAARITNEYIPGDERSFTIIAYPIPEIGEAFEEIFHKTIEINTLDYEVYKDIQQVIIDGLDGCEYVNIKGTNGNETDINVSITRLLDSKKQTAFENCVADVNIPLGEVFTSPVLKGTTGVVNVSQVYLNDIRFDNLKVTFTDGMITDYSCDNFKDINEGKRLIKQVVLYDHETLPMGEFAIGTNTLAYVMANHYDIVYKLPILIVEKMGPHFAVGDTCYSWSEDTAVYNPNGKEIIARDNEISRLRTTDISKAYFNCHTDITIPYDEIGSIDAISADGRVTRIIENGRFVLKGTELLNKPFNNNKGEN